MPRQPLLPPPRVTQAVLRFRTAVARLHRATAPPEIRVMEGLFGLFDNRALGLLVELGVPDALDRPRTAAELAAAIGDGQADANNLDRVLRYAAGRGFLRRDRRGRYRRNGVTKRLTTTNPDPWRGWAEFAGSDWFWNSWRHLDAPVRKAGVSGTEAATGHPFFEYVNRVNPEAGRAFNDAMRAGSTLQAFGLAKTLDWSGVTSVCDVGGGTGATLEQIVAVHPHLRATLFDLPEVVAGAKDPHPFEAVGGSFFDGVPSGFERYLLLAIVHDWDDESAARILRQVAEAMTAPASRAVVVEGVLSPRPRDDFVQATDLMMLALASGRERTDQQFASLFARSGLAIERRILLPTGFVAFQLRRSGAGSSGPIPVPSSASVKR